MIAQLMIEKNRSILKVRFKVRLRMRQCEVKMEESEVKRNDVMAPKVALKVALKMAPKIPKMILKVILK